MSVWCFSPQPSLVHLQALKAERFFFYNFGWLAEVNLWKLGAILEGVTPFAHNAVRCVRGDKNLRRDEPSSSF